MKTGVTTVILLVCMAAASQVSAQQLQSFSLPDVASEKNFSLSDFSSRRGLILIFSSPKCPYDDYYTGRLLDLIRTYGESIPVVFVASGSDADEASMREHLRSEGIPGPFLADKAGVLKGNLNATKTPEAFLLKNDNGVFSVVYHGAIDNNPQVAADVDQPYLKNAISELLQGGAVSQKPTRPVGCSIR